MILCLYAGKDDDSSTKAAFIQEAPHLTEFVLELELDRHLPFHDVLDDRNFQELILVAASGKLLGILGGPNCRTWSILRHFPKVGFPGVVRNRSGEGVWGKPGLSSLEQTDVDNDSLLLLRMLLLYHVACQFGGSSPFFLMEHPADPAETSSSPKGKDCSSWWVTPQHRSFRDYTGMKVFTLDQCMLGHKVDKSTSLLTNLLLGFLHRLQCNHPGGHHGFQGNSKTLARWAWGLNVQIVRAVVLFLQNVRPSPSQITMPLDSPLCQEHDYEKPVLGHRSRVLRDGGGIPSPGARHPDKREPPKLSHIGVLLRSALDTPLNGEHHLKLRRVPSRNAFFSLWEMESRPLQSRLRRLEP